MKDLIFIPLLIIFVIWLPVESLWIYGFEKESIIGKYLWLVLEWSANVKQD